jgi:hypothetical protein
VVNKELHLVERVDHVCGRLTDGLSAMAIVLALLVATVATDRGANALDIPEGFRVAAAIYPALYRAVAWPLTSAPASRETLRKNGTDASEITATAINTG